MPAPIPLRLPVETLAKALTQAQAAALNLPLKGLIEISVVKENVWLLSIPTPQTQLNEGVPFAPKPIHQKVLKLLQSHKLPDVIEGRFEVLLSAEELTAFQELRAANRIVCVKTNPKYDKGIYREAKFESAAALAPGVSAKPAMASKPAVHAPISEKPVEEYSLIGDGFTVLRSEGAAKVASFDLAERIKAGEIKGIKSFDGFYYIIENALLNKHTPRILALLQQKKTIELDELSAQLGIPLVLVRIALEFAKEDGVVIEKKRNLFAYVG